MQHVTWMVTACVTRGQPLYESCPCKAPPVCDVLSSRHTSQHHPEEILTHLFLDGDCFRVDN